MSEDEVLEALTTINQILAKSNEMAAQIFRDLARNREMMIAINRRLDYYFVKVRPMTITIDGTELGPIGDMPPTECCGQVFTSWTSYQEHLKVCPFRVESENDER